MQFEIQPQLKQKLDEAPKKPGAYIFRDGDGNIIYVGKAVNLFNRSRSYFVNYMRLDPRIRNMVELARDIEYHVVDSELEALLLETNLIKKYLPKYNVLMTDDKGYLWVEIKSYLDFPIVRLVREKKDDKAEYFGPFLDSGAVRRMLKDVRRIFKYRTCSRRIEAEVAESGEEVIMSSDVKPCLYFHIGLCSAPCTTTQSRLGYREQVNNLKRFLRSDHKELRDSLAKRMKKYAQEKRYEDAAMIRNRLRELENLTLHTRIDENIDDVKLTQQKEMQSLLGITELIEKLEIPELKVENTSPAEFKIECYDISNIQGTNATAAMVVFVAGKSAKQLYRKFKIKTKDTPDDFAMLKETLGRRMKYLLPEEVTKTVETENSEKAKQKVDESFNKKPDLIVIDGGKGQLSSVIKVMKVFEKDYGIKIPCIGLAKKQEEVFVPVYAENDELSDFRLVKMSRRSMALRILQQARDEAHRFGLGYHRLLRSKGMTYSQLDLIPGVGKVLRKKLIDAFGSVEGIKKASIEDITSIIKNRKTAFKIKKLLV